MTNLGSHSRVVFGVGCMFPPFMQGNDWILRVGVRVTCYASCKLGSPWAMHMAQ